MSKHNLIQKLIPDHRTKYFLLIFVPFWLVVSAIFLGFFYQNQHAQKHRLSVQLEADVALLKEFAAGRLRSIVTDLLVLATQRELRLYLEQGSPAQLRHLEQAYLAFARSKGLYDQVRFLTMDGMEMVRIDYGGGKPYIVPKAKLQDNARRYYFADTIRLKNGEIFISSLDLNIERGKIGKPLKPMIRLGTPVFDLQGRKRGIVLLNYFGELLIQDIKRAAAHSPGYFMLLNPQGYWLCSPRREDQWGFMYQGRRDCTFSRAYPEAWKRIRAADSGQFETPAGLFTFVTVWPIGPRMKSSTDSGLAYQPSAAQLGAKDYFWKIVIFTPGSLWGVGAGAYMHKWLLAYGLLLLALGLGSWGMASLVMRRRESESWLRQIIDLVPSLIFVKNIEGKFLLVNHAVADAYGTTVKDLTGKYEAGFASSCEEVKHFREDDLKVFETGQTRYIPEEEIIDYGGHVRFLQTIKTPFIWEGTKDSAILCVATDITDRKRAEEALRAKTMMLNNILHSAHDIAIATTDLDFRITYYNPMAEKLFGYTSAEVVGKTVMDIHTQEKVEPERFKRAVESVHREGQYRYCIKQETDQGPRYLDSRIAGIFDLDGDLVGFSLFSRDITKRLRDEDNIRLFKTISDMSVHGNAVVDLQGNITYVNDYFAQIHGYTPDELVGRNLSVFHNEKQMESVRRIIQSLKEKGSFSPIEVWHTHKDGMEFPMLMNGIVITDDNGVPQYMAATAIDITDWKQAEEENKRLESQLHQSQKMEAIGTLAGGIAHDFNNILSGIIGYAQLAKLDLDDPEKTKKNIDQVLKGAQRASGLIQQILTFSRHTECKKNPLKLFLIVKEAVKFLRSSIPASIKIEEKVISRAMVLADPTQIHQIVMNLCTNAYHAMCNSGGILTVKLTEVEILPQDPLLGNTYMPGNYVKLEVQDTGHGMDKKILERIFDPYFTTKQADKGTGLGLAVVDGIVKSHDGFIKVYSEPGHGSTFQVFLSVVEKQSSLNNTDKNKAGLPKGTEQIMLVDDEKSILNTLQAILERQGYKIAAFKDGRSALYAFTKDPGRFDLVITDMTMPEMTGNELSARILNIRKDVPIILCTGYSETFTENMALKIGIRRYVQKPVASRRLTALIRELLDESRTESEV